MSDLVGNPEDRFSQNEAHILSDLPVSPAELEIKSSPTKERARILKRQDRVSSPDQEDVIVSPDQGVVSPDQEERVSSPDQEDVSVSPDQGVVSPGQEERVSSPDQEDVSVSPDQGIVSPDQEERVSSPDQEDVSVSPDQGIVSPEDSLGVSHVSERTEGEVTNSSDQQTDTPYAEVNGAISDGKENTDNTIKIEPLPVSVSSNCTKEEENLLCNNVLDTDKSESEHVNKSEQISEQVTDSDKGEISSEPNENTGNALRQTEEMAEYFHSYSDTMVTVMQDQDVLNSSIGMVNIPELVSSSSVENPVIVVMDYPVTSEVETEVSESHQ